MCGTKLLIHAHYTPMKLGDIDSGNGLLPDGTRQLPEPVLISEDLRHSPEDNSTWNVQDVYPWYEFWTYPLFKITAVVSAGGNELIDTEANLWYPPPCHWLTLNKMGKSIGTKR